MADGLSEKRLSSFRQRLDVLEKLLTGSEGIRSGQPSLMQSIAELNQKLGDLVSSDGIVGVGNEEQSPLPKLWSKIEQLERLLGTDVTSATLPEDAKAELLVTYANQLSGLCKDLDQLRGANEFLNTSEFGGLEKHEKVLAGIARRHTQQEAELQALTQRSKDVLNAYQKAMFQISTQCVVWDELLTTLERQK